MFLSTPSRAEEKSGDALQLAKDAVLRKLPNDNSASLGKLPAGTLLSNRGERKNRFVSVEVELEDGDTVEGWVEESTLRDFDAKTIPQGDADNENQLKVKKKRKKRIEVPKDEVALMRREPSFFYGAYVGGDYAIIQPNLSSNSNTYANPGAMGGAFFGFYIDRAVPLRFELGFSQANGASPNDTVNLSFNFLDIAVVPTFVIDPIELFGGVQYSVGLGLADVPVGLTLPSASNLSSVWVLAGIGYRIDVANLVTLALRVKWSTSLQHTYFNFNVFSGVAALEFRG